MKMGCLFCFGFKKSPVLNPLKTEKAHKPFLGFVCLMGIN